jgi:RNA polymerase sigma-70 factor (ECF subfamily)
MRTDEELMAAYADGDQAAFHELFRRLSPVLLRVMRQSLRRPGDAEDLVQQTFLQLHRSRADYQRGRPLRPWLFTIAMNLKREYFRRLGRRPEQPLEAAAEPATDAVGARRTDAQRTLEYALGRLNPDQREVIMLHWLADVPLPEVAKIVGASLSAVKVRAHRGYAAMRRLLEEDRGNSRDG